MPLLWLSLAFVSGILLAAWLQLAWTAYLGLAALCLAAWLGLWHFAPSQNRFAHAAPGLRLPLAALLIALLAGAARYQAAHPPLSPGDIAWYNNLGPLAITGVVDEPPDARENYTSLRVKVRQIAPSPASPGEAPSAISAPQPARGFLLAMIAPGKDYHYGDLVELTGSLTPPTSANSFSYPDYLARHGISATLDNPKVKLLDSGMGSPAAAWMYAAKEKGLHILATSFPSPEAELLQGILLGVDKNIPEDLAQAYITTGTAHIIAISGFNIAILAGLFSLLFTRLLGKRWGALAAALAIGLYTCLVGAGASVVRAAVMAWMGLLGVQLGRQQTGSNSLAFTAAVMCLFTPDLPWDVSFQLSFAATLGLVLYAQPLQDGFVLLVRRFLPGALALRLGTPVGEFGLFTLAAQATTLPVMIYHFQRLSLISLVANPLVLPVQPAVMVLGGLSMLLGLVYMPLGQISAYIAWPFVAYTNRAVEWLAAVPQRTLNLGEFSLIFVVLLYAILFGATLAQSWRSALRRILSPAVLITGAAAATLLAWQVVFAMPDGRLHLVMLGSGPPATFLIQSPGGRAVLINGGADANKLKAFIDRRTPFYNRRLDALVVAAGQKGVQAAPAVLEAIPSKLAWWCGPPDASPAAAQLNQSLSDLSIPILQAQVGQSLDLGGDVRLRILTADDSGTVLLLEWHAFSAWLPFPRAADKPVTAAHSPSRRQAVSVLLLAGGGQAALNPADGLAALQPQLILASLEADASKPGIDPAVQAVLNGFPILTSRDHGWIEVSTDGEKMWVTTER